MAKAEITVEGFVSKDPESRVAGNHSITTVTVPVEQGRMKDGQWVADTDQQGNKIVVWWEAEFWNEHGDVVAQTIRKKDLVVLRGEARPRVYVKNDGTPGLGATIANGSVAKIVPRPSRQNRSGGTQSGWAQPPSDQGGFGGQAGAGAQPGGGFGGFGDEKPF